jgi:hypothetical protein
MRRGLPATHTLTAKLENQRSRSRRSLWKSRGNKRKLHSHHHQSSDESRQWVWFQIGRKVLMSQGNYLRKVFTFVK